MRPRLLRHVAGAFAVLCSCATVASAQSTREEWLALRTTKQARHHQLTEVATAPNALNITTIRFFPDAAGNLVGVGVASNDSALDLSYSRINFRFFDSSGRDLGGEWTYVFGGPNARILSNDRYETVLLRGTTGFFKIWTTIPASSMSRYTAASAGEALAFAAPLARIGSGSGPPSSWQPMVFIWGRPSVSGQQVTGSVLNDDPLDPFCPCGWHSILAYSIRVAVAVYQDALISDVQSVLVTGNRSGDQCGGEPPTTGIALHETASFTIDLVRAADRVGSQSIEWEEMGVFPRSLGLSGDGGSARFSVRKCGWTAVPTVPWITVTEGASSAARGGEVTIAAPENPTQQNRTAAIDVSGMSVSVVQYAPFRCQFSPSTMFVGSGLIDYGARTVSSNCSLFYTAASAPWVRTDNSTLPMRFKVLQPNLTGATRSATFSLGAATMTVYQNPGSRNADFNGDGSLDLLWHHETDGRVAGWLMRGTQRVDGRLLTPSQVPDTNWKPVAVGDLDRDGMVDIVWQHAADGRISFWRMRDTTMMRGDPLPPGQVADTNWKIRGIADFNQDGDGDLVWQNEATGQIALWLLRLSLYGPTLLGGNPLGPGRVADLNWKIVGTGDFNRDGWPDLVWQHQRDGRIAVWQMDGTTLVRGDLISPGQVFDLDWKIRGVGDINGDDMPDLIWQHRVSGHVSAWIMNGTTMVSGVSLGQVPDTNWQIVGPR